MPAKYRHEWKYEINKSDCLVLNQRLRAVMKPDTNSTDGGYKIRSLYFDNLYDKALREKVDGVNDREKFRIRYYNGDTSFIRLEKKCKKNGLCRKESAAVTCEEVRMLLEGNTQWMKDSCRPLVAELYSKMLSEGLRPKTIVDYKRQAYIYGPGNVRVTLDSDIRTGMRNTDFLNPDSVTVPAGDIRNLLEVKWDEFLPSVIQAAVGLDSRSSNAFSKYMVCRMYG